MLVMDGYLTSDELAERLTRSVRRQNPPLVRRPHRRVDRRAARTRLEAREEAPASAETSDPKRIVTIHKPSVCSLRRVKETLAVHEPPTPR